MINLKAPIYSVRTALKTTLFFLTVIILIQLIIPAINGRRPSLYFDEGSVITWLSSLQLLLMGFLAHKIYLLEKRQRRSKSWIFWRLLNLSFIFLAVDDLLEIHERIDNWIQSLLQVGTNPLLTRIDDLIVVLYGWVILFLIYSFRKDLGQYRPVLPLLVITLVLGLIMVGIDVINHNADDLTIFVSDFETRMAIYKYLGPVEEMFKIWAEGFLLNAMYGCWQIQYRISESKY